MALKNIKWPNSSGAGHGSDHVPHTESGKPKWRTIIGLLMVYGATALNWHWIWGFFSLYWIAPDLFSGVTYFTEPIYRKNNPVLYWLILITWIVFGIVMFFPSVSVPSAS